ncbi:MAG: hypothetical protein HC913_17440 [Microscillaceae bacterium]|nr:hypothetical protein [Microscillaceae bacterium]
MAFLIPYFIYLPVLGFLISFFFRNPHEKAISWVVFLTVGLHLHLALVFVGFWIVLGQPVLDIQGISLLKTPHYEFFIDFHFDKITAVYLLVGAFLTFLVTIYSRYYLHKELGYKRYFNTILFFYLGYNLSIFAGNFEMLLVGWELLGVSSFLLIAFYRNRYLPVKNAVKVFSVYRIGDVGLILAMWASHHLFHENITFLKLSQAELVSSHLQNHTLAGAFIALMILITACAKSAQFPFSSWLPRAMEGPTPSSAIFYGALSVHLGVFLLMRTFPFWEHQWLVRLIIGLVGLTTALVATGTARVQSSVKSQIAYASISQIGLIFIEIAMGWENLALLHFAGNAFLRTYQLLVSPSVVTYLIREQFYHYQPHPPTIEDSLPKKLEYALYILCLKEWNLDTMLYRYLWNPVKWAGHKLDFYHIKGLFLFSFPIFLLGLFCLYFEAYIEEEVEHYLTIPFALIGLLMVLKAFTERKRVLMSLLLVMMNHFWIALAVSFNENFDFREVLLYLSGILISGMLGYGVIQQLKKSERQIDLDRFQGHVLKHPKLAAVFLMVCLGLSGFPISPTFIGEDLIFSHIHSDQLTLAFLVALSFIIDGLTSIRIYARVFLGPNVHTVYERAYRSS